MSGISDVMFDVMIGAHLADNIDLIDDAKLLSLVSSVIGDEYFYHASRKASVYLVLLLVVSELRASKIFKTDKDNGVHHHLELLCITQFYSFIHSTQEGYKWINSFHGLMHEAWLYLKSKRGRFSPHIKILHEETQESIELASSLSRTSDEDENDDVEEDFSEATNSEIGSLFVSEGEAATSDEEVFSMMNGEDDSSDNPEVKGKGGQKPYEKSEVIDDESIDIHSETESESVLDIAKLIG
ncbi:hypothetical protein [Alteromonas sp. KUL42]|nr:hypothetical protein [Alteromonas sp. KUL42]